MEQGVVGDLVCSQVCTGERNHVSIRVWGDKGSLTWSHDTCDALKFTAIQMAPKLQTTVQRNRAPSGHPAGFVEAFANIYSDCADKMQGRDIHCVGASDGLASMKWIHAVLQSMESQTWSDV